MTGDSGLIVTVEGRIDPDDLSVTLPHEHLLKFGKDAQDDYDFPESAYEREIAESQISLENLWWIHQQPAQHLDNLELSSLKDAVEELEHFRSAGGNSVVDVTPKQRGSDPRLLRAIAMETGLNIVRGTSFYTVEAHPERVESATIEAVADEFVNDVREGIGDTDVRAGLIGEIGLSGHIHEQEEKVLRAGARAARRTGAALSVHPPGRTPYSQKDRTYPSSRWGLDILDITEEEGVPPDRVILCHQDRSAWYNDLSYEMELAERGAYVEYDLFGYVRYYEEFQDTHPSDAQRVEYLSELIKAGYGSRLLISHDIFTKHRLKKYGGHGYSHILENIVPIFEGLDTPEEAVRNVLIENPKRVLTFDDPT
jgi:phosphotriesterase-related protein